MASIASRAEAARLLLRNEPTFVLQVVQPALAGLMDGSASTVAPILATAFATHRSRTAFLIGFAAAVGAGISMALVEGLSDSGLVTGHEKPLIQGLITGLMTLLRGLLHTLPFLISRVHPALDVAYGTVGIALIAISWIRYRYLKTSFVTSCLQVMVAAVWSLLLVFSSGGLVGLLSSKHERLENPFRFCPGGLHEEQIRH